jgi:hypothetical protein
MRVVVYSQSQFARITIHKVWCAEVENLIALADVVLILQGLDRVLDSLRSQASKEPQLEAFQLSDESDERARQKREPYRQRAAIRFLG